MVLSRSGSAVTQQTGSMIRVPAKVNGSRVVAVVDTGSTATCISRTIAQQCGSTLYPFKGPQMASVNGEDVHPSGMMAVNLTVFDGPMEVALTTLVLVIDKLNCELLLGNNFNKKARLLVDCESGTRGLHTTIRTESSKYLGPWIPLDQEEYDLGLGEAPPPTPEPALQEQQDDIVELGNLVIDWSPDPPKLIHFPLKSKSNHLIPPQANEVVAVQLQGILAKDASRYKVGTNNWNLMLEDEFVNFIGNSGFIICRNLTNELFQIKKGETVAFINLPEPVAEKVEGKDYWNLYSKHHYRLRRRAEVRIPVKISFPETLDRVEYFRITYMEPKLVAKKRYVKLINQHLEWMEVSSIFIRDFVLLSDTVLARVERLTTSEIEAFLEESIPDPAKFLEVRLKSQETTENIVDPLMSCTSGELSGLPSKLMAMTDIILFPGISASLDVQADCVVGGSSILEIQAHEIGNILAVPLQHVKFNEGFGNVEVRNISREVVYIMKNKFKIHLNQSKSLLAPRSNQQVGKKSESEADPTHHTGLEVSQLNMFRAAGRLVDGTPRRQSIRRSVPFIVPHEQSEPGNSQAKEESAYLEQAQPWTQDSLLPLVAMGNAVIPAEGSEAVRVFVDGILPSMYQEYSLVARNPRVQPRINVATFTYGKADIVFHNFTKLPISVIRDAVIGYVRIKDPHMEQLEGRDYWNIVMEIPTKLQRNSQVELPVRLSFQDSLNTVERFRIFETLDYLDIDDNHIEVRNQQIDGFKVKNISNRLLKLLPGKVVARVSRCECVSVSSMPEKNEVDSLEEEGRLDGSATIAMLEPSEAARPETPRPPPLSKLPKPAPAPFPRNKRKHLFSVVGSTFQAGEEKVIQVEAIGYQPDPDYTYFALRVDENLDPISKTLSFTDKFTEIKVRNVTDETVEISSGHLIAAVELDLISINRSPFKPVYARNDVIVTPNELKHLEITIDERRPLAALSFYMMRSLTDKFKILNHRIPVNPTSNTIIQVRNESKTSISIAKGEVIAEARRMSPQEIEAVRKNGLADLEFADEILRQEEMKEAMGRQAASGTASTGIIGMFQMKNNRPLPMVGFPNLDPHETANFIRNINADPEYTNTHDYAEINYNFSASTSQLPASNESVGVLGMFHSKNNRPHPMVALPELNAQELEEFFRHLHADHDYMNTHDYTEINYSAAPASRHPSRSPSGNMELITHSDGPEILIEERNTEAESEPKLVVHTLRVRNQWSLFSGMLLTMLIFLLFFRLTEALNFDEHLTRLHQQQNHKADARQFWMRILMFLTAGALTLGLSYWLYKKVVFGRGSSASRKHSASVILHPESEEGHYTPSGRNGYIMNLHETGSDKTGFLPLVDSFTSDKLGSGVVQISESLEAEERLRIQELLEAYFDVFAFDDTEIGYFLFDVPKNGTKHPSTYRELLQTHMHQILKVAKTNIEKAQQVTASRYNSSHTPVEYQENDKVLIRFPTRKVGLAEKLGHPWRGPFVIRKKITPLVYEVELVTGRNKKRTSVHISRMKPYYDREEPGSSESEDSSRIEDPIIPVQPNAALETRIEETQPTVEAMSECSASVTPMNPPASNTPPEQNEAADQCSDSSDDHASMINQESAGTSDSADETPRVRIHVDCPEASSDSSSVSDVGSSSSDYKTPATRNIDRARKAQLSSAELNQTPIPNEPNASNPRRSTRVKKPSTRHQALFLLAADIIGLIIRSLIHQVELKREYIEWCENAFQEDVIKPLRKFCHDIDGETGSTNSIVLNRPKRLVVMTAIVIGVVIAVGVGTLATYLGVSTASDLRNQLTIMEKKLSEASKNLELSHKIIREIENSIETLGKAVEDNRKHIRRIESGLPKANIIVAHLTAQLRDVKTKLIASARSWRMKKLDHLLLETLNITLPCDDDCPLSLATPKTCVLHSGKRTLQISFDMTKTDPNITILKADPFRMISYKGDQVCLKTYTGPAALLLNRKDDCIHPISDKAFSSTGFVASAGPVPCMTPDFTGSADRFWYHQGCAPRSSMSPLDYIQIKLNGKDNHLLCPQMLISIHGTNATCPDYVFSLPHSVPFQVGTFVYRAGSTALDAGMQIESDWIHRINFIMDPPQKPLDLKINETNALLESWTTESTFQLQVPTPSFHIVPWLFMTIGILGFFWYCRKQVAASGRDGIQSVELITMSPDANLSRPKRQRKNVVPPEQSESSATAV
ncbi:hypothetical protein HDE_02607 [Halotydeus destructor]|nr:hypothetical protein HDE_02607 [Halotydeus destructor]